MAVWQAHGDLGFSELVCVLVPPTIYRAIELGSRPEVHRARAFVRSWMLAVRRSPGAVPIVWGSSRSLLKACCGRSSSSSGAEIEQYARGHVVAHASRALIEGIQVCDLEMAEVGLVPDGYRLRDQYRIGAPSGSSR